MESTPPIPPPGDGPNEYDRFPCRRSKDYLSHLNRIRAPSEFSIKAGLYSEKLEFPNDQMQKIHEAIETHGETNIKVVYEKIPNESAKFKIIKKKVQTPQEPTNRGSEPSNPQPKNINPRNKG